MAEHPLWHDDTRVPAPSKTRKPVQPWMMEFAEWLAKQHKNPDRARQVHKLTMLARKWDALEEDEVFDEKDLGRVKRMVTWKEYYDVIRDGGVRAARRMMRDRGQYVVDMHFHALLKAHEANDYGAVFKGTNAYLQQVVPDRMAGPQNAIQINLTVEQAKVLEEADVVPVAVEVLDAESLQPE